MYVDKILVGKLRNSDRLVTAVANQSCWGSLELPGVYRLYSADQCWATGI